MYGKNVDSNLESTYEIESKLGAGGCGAVYKAWHKRLQKHIVLKELKDSSHKAVEVRRNEIEALKNVKNMYIPQVFDFLMEGGSSFTVMEYVEGESLDKLIDRGEFFPESLVTKWFYQLATALEALHSKGVCHRDIKPANIIKTPNGDVCLIDFNSALVSGNNTRTVNRSIGYASPEQYLYFEKCEKIHRKRAAAAGAYARTNTEMMLTGMSGGSLRHRSVDWMLSDIYSLGATMHHLFTGYRPLLPQEGTTSELKVAENVPGLAGIIERCMRVNPAQRFASAHELRYALLQNKAYRTNNFESLVSAVEGNGLMW